MVWPTTQDGGLPMFRFVIGAATLVAVAGQITGQAAAADLRPRTYEPPPMMQPIPLGWTGFYLGGNVGGGWGQGDSDFSVGAAQFGKINNSLSGFLGGAQLGYNWQSGPMVYGLETDIQYSGLRGEVDSPTCPAAICGVALGAKYKQDVNWFGTVRGRVGYADAGWLAYLTGGYAYAHLETSATGTAGAVTANFSANDMRNGWTIGAGVELMLSQNWSAKLEYLHLDFGTDTSNLILPGLPTITDNASLTMEVVRAGVNYRF
jgi:outer membrane immunogenic protein